MVFQLLDHLLDPLLEVAAIAGAGQKRAHVEREDGGALKHFRHLVADDLQGQALGDGGLAHARVADEQRVVLGPAAQDLDAALDLVHPADERIDLALASLLVEVDAIGLQGLAAGLDGGLLLVGLAGVRALGLFGLGGAGLLGDAVGDVVDRVVPRHVLLLQEVGGVALALGEDGDQHIGAGDLVAPGGLDVDHGALDHALEAGGRLGVLAILDDQAAQFGVEIAGQGLPDGRQVHVAGAHHPRRVLVVRQGQEQMLQGRILVLTLVGVGHGAVEGLFEIARKRGQAGLLNPFP